MTPASDVAHIRYSLAKALAEKEKDAQENKIRYYLPACLAHYPGRCPADCRSSKHRDFHSSLARNRFVFGGNCLGAESRIVDRLHGTIKAKDALGMRLEVLSWNGKGFEWRKAEPVQLCGLSPMVEVEFEDGTKTKVADGHRFLARNNRWVLAADCEGEVLLSGVCDPLLSNIFSSGHLPGFSVTPEGSIPDVSLSNQRQGVSRWIQKVRDFLIDYRESFHSNDGQLLLDQENDQDEIPSRGDALERSLQNLHKDERECEEGYIHSCRSIAHRSREDFSRREPRVYSSRSRQITSHGEYARVRNSSGLQCPDKIDQERTGPESFQHPEVSTNGVPCHDYKPIWRKVKRVNFLKGFEPYFDLHVPGLENYVADGIVGHNSSGKTILGLTEMIIRMCYSRHPYNGLELPHPAFHRIEFESFRNWESYYLPLLKEWIPRKMLVGNSWSDAYNVKFSLLRLKNGDSVDALSYDMNVDKFESSTIHDIWADEKMPEEIYDANLSRLLRTNGYLWNTVTPINGMPWVMTRVWGIDTSDTKTWVMDMDENPYISKEAKTRILEQMSPEEREARKSGRPMQFQGIVYPEISESIHLTDKKPESYWPIYFCLDAHPRKPAFGVWVAVGPSEELIVIDEMELKGTPRELANHIFHKEFEIRRWIGGGSFKGIVKRKIDLSALTLDSDIQDHYDLLAEFSKLGLSFSQANRSSVGYTQVKNYLFYDKQKAVGPFNKPMLTFAKGRVPKTWFSMTHILYEEYRSRQGKDPKEKVKDWGKDPADCVRYICIEKPRYASNFAPVQYGGQASVSCYTER